KLVVVEAENDGDPATVQQGQKSGTQLVVGMNDVGGVNPDLPDQTSQPLYRLDPERGPADSMQTRYQAAGTKIDRVHEVQFVRGRDVVRVPHREGTTSCPSSSSVRCTR